MNKIVDTVKRHPDFTSPNKRRVERIVVSDQYIAEAGLLSHHNEVGRLPCSAELSESQKIKSAYAQ